MVVSTLSNLNIIYNNEGIEDKRRIIGAIFRKKFTFQDLQDRTAVLKDSFEYMFLINKNLKIKKTGQKTFENLLPREGWAMGLEPTTLGTTNQYSNQLSYAHRFVVTKVKIFRQMSSDIILKIAYCFYHLKNLI